MSNSDYLDFLHRRTHISGEFGFDPDLPDFLFDFQAAQVRWACRRGRGALLNDCGLGKTPMQLVWADQIHRHTGRPVLILAPLAVGSQTVAEGIKFGIEVTRSRDGSVYPITVTNYEKLHLFDPTDFGGVVCDESSILKSFSGATQKAVTRFVAKLPYRLLCTATAAPNDYIELGTSSEALGELGYSDMLSRFFRQTDKKSRRDQVKESTEARGDHYARLAYRVSQQIGQWRLKGHAVTPFWKWVASWSRACRRPSDLGFSDDLFILPPLEQREHVFHPERPPDGMLFTLPAFGLQEEREERRRTLKERCELAAGLVDHDKPAVVWCHLNAEGDHLAKIIPGSIQVKGANSDEEKEEAYRAFASGHIRVLVIKPKIGAWGLNWQHCSHVVTFASHSYEQFYQSVRRCWRFGQLSPVTVDIIATEGERHVIDNMARKSAGAEVMFAELVSHMNEAIRIAPITEHPNITEVPPWACSIK